MRKRTTMAALFLIAALVLGLSVILMPGCSSSDNSTNNENVIQGTVTDSESGAKLEGVTVSSGDKSTTTDSSGFYKLTGFIGGRHIIKASKDGFGNYSAEVIVSSWQPTVYNFSMTGNTPGVSKVTGTVTDGTWNPVGVEGVTVTVGGKSATTDSDGKYEISDVEVKNMTLTATKVGYVDYSADIDVAEGTTTTHNFIMVLKADTVVTFMSSSNNMTSIYASSSPVYAQKVYVRRKYDGITEPCSLASPDILVPGSAVDPSISANGRYVVYTYQAPSDGSPSTSAFQDINGVFVYDRYTGETELVSKNSDGTPGNDRSYAYPQLAVSADGRYVAFQSSSTNLVDGDDNGFDDVFIHDRETGITKKVSNSYDGGSVNNTSYEPAISADGRYVVFRTNATNVVEGFSTSQSRIYVYDSQTETITVASLNDNGEDANGASYDPTISANGQYVVFSSDASNLVVSGGAGSLASYSQIYLRDRTAGTTTLISKNSSDAVANGGCYNSIISSDGRYVAYYSYATNLTDGLVSGNAQVFVYDRTTGETTLVSRNLSGTEGNNSCYYGVPSSAGDVVLFDSYSSDLVENDTNDSNDVFVYNIKTGTVERLSVNSDGEEGNRDSYMYYD